MSFLARLKLALSILFGARPPEQPALPSPAPVPVPVPTPVAPPAPEVVHASALFVLGLLQREGRLLDFVQEDLSAFSDADVGAAARVVHDGCKKVFAQYLAVSPIATEGEGASVEVPKGFDASRFRLTGNVTGEGPWRGALKHHGWVTTKVGFPEPPTSVDLLVLAPAEVELP